MAIQDSRILIKRSTTTGVVPTVPASNDHTDGTWLTTDIYKGELFYNVADNILYTRDDNAIRALCGYTPCDTRCASLTIASADVLQLASSPQVIIPAQGVGTSIDVLSVVCKYNHGGTDYSGGGNILIYDLSGPQFYMNGTLQATGDRFVKGIPSTPTGSDSNLTENSPIYIATLAEPTLGDGDFEFWVLYRVITL